MKFHRIWAIFLRYLMIIPRDFGRLASLFYWPVIDLLLWGYTAVWIQTTGTESSHFLMALVMSAIFWQIVSRAHFDVSWSLLEEIHTQNLMNLFASPLLFSEWVAAVVLLSFCMSTFLLFVINIASWLLYGLTVFQLGMVVIPLFVLLVLSGLNLGFLAVSFLIYGGRRVESLVWMMSWLLAPVSSVFYPVEVLPIGLQYVSKAIPMTYAFGAMRTFIFTGILDSKQLLIGYVLASVYLVLTLALFFTFFNKSKKYGLARLTD